MKALIDLKININLSENAMYLLELLLNALILLKVARFKLKKSTNLLLNEEDFKYLETKLSLSGTDTHI